MAAHSFDVLVVGSGASGLAAAVSAERAGARVGLATKGSVQACNSAKAQGGIQAAFGETTRRRSARGRDALVARHRQPAPGRGADERGRTRSTGWKGSASSSRARTVATGWRAAAARHASGCCRWATGRGTRSRRRCARRSNRRHRAPVPRARGTRAGGLSPARDLHDEGRLDRGDRGQRGRARGRRALLRGGHRRGELSTIIRTPRAR